MNWLDDLYSDFSAEDDFSSAYVLGFLERHRLLLEGAVADGIQSERLLEILAWIAFHLAVSKRSIEALRFGERAVRMYPPAQVESSNDFAKQDTRIAWTALALAYFHLRRTKEALLALKECEINSPGEAWATSMRRLMLVMRGERTVNRIWYCAAGLLGAELMIRLMTGHGSLVVSLLGAGCVLVAVIWGALNKRLDRLLRAEFNAHRALLNIVR